VWFHRFHQERDRPISFWMGYDFEVQWPES
jgi:hypothetical protein